MSSLYKSAEGRGVRLMHEGNIFEESRARG